MAYTNTGNCSMSLELSDRLQAMATDVLAGAAANVATGFANEMMGNLPRARHCFQKVIDVPLSDGGSKRASRFVADPLILARGNQLRILALMGLPEESSNRWKKNLTVANSSGLDPRSIAGLLIEGAWYHAFYHRFDETLKLTERTIDICKKYDFFMENQWATFLQNWANTQVGDAKQGLAGIESFIAFIDATGVLMHAPLYYATYSDILFESGHAEKAAIWVNRGLEVIEHTGQNYFASEIYRLQGLIAAARQQNELSLTTLKKAHRMAREQDARLLEMRAALSLNSILANTGAVDDGTRMLSETVSRMHDGFQSKELLEASSILKVRI